MSNSDERREVAARLRDEGYELSEIDAGVELASLALEDALGVDHMRGWCDEFDRLADLIDPTCEVESVDSTGGLLAYLLSCGHTAYRPAYIQGPPPVCPSCGARVANSGE